MRSVFTKKSKMKFNSKIKFESTTENELMLKLEEQNLTDDQNDNLQNKLILKSKIVKHNSIDKKKSNINNKSSSSSITTVAAAAVSQSSSSDVFIRRGLGVSVTFESTLPTQIWQASPSPSPPLSEHITYDTNNQITKNPTLCLLNSKNSESSNVNIRMNHKSRHGSLNDIHELDDSSDETNPSRLSYPSLSSCTSSDETTTSQERLSHRLSSSTSDSSSSLDLNILPTNGTHSVKKNDKKHPKGKKDGETDRYANRKVISEKRRQYTSQGLSSSSTSTSSEEEDLEAYGWDEKTISALTNRNKSNMKCHITPSKMKSEVCFKSTNEYSTSPKRAPPGQKSDLRWKPDTRLSRLKLSSPVRICNQFHVDVPITYPQTCIVPRRLNSVMQFNYPNTTSLAQQPYTLPTNSFVQNSSLTNTELLAVVNIDFRPSAEWKERYKLLGVRQGEYVCVLNQSLSSPTNTNSMYGRTKTAHAQHKAMFPLTENNFWLYVRRWCVDHLIATGTPGYIPRQTCRVLSNCEITSLTCASRKGKSPWNGSSNKHMLPKEYRMNNTPIQKHLIMQTHNEFRPSQPTKNRDLTSTNSSSNATHSNQVTGMFSTQLDKRNAVYSLQNITSDTSQNFLPPPPPGFGSGGSIGSETEDKDSGRGPSSGSEWGSGRGGSSNITLDRSVADHTSSEMGLNYQGSQSDRRSRNVKSAEESQLGWYAPTGLEWPDQNFHPGEESLSRDSAFQSPNTDNLTPSPHMKEATQPNVNQSLTMQQVYLPSAVTLTTITGSTPVLEMRHNGTPTLCAREIPTVSTTNALDSLATSTSTCATVVDIREVQDECTNNSKTGPTTKLRVPTPDPSYWEPYKTVIHVNETSLEKFTLV
ncbi:hypothetical protein MN116_004001 [Schistosoma mekongi]|uniref:Uncharacterized protein n=1 Tax=Schistosoma mekongi TaxID=38744 RepID=A0AAE2D645_SCHME|nr:hypothetical protein MN116_004001 [Schistosoma mekongi]